MAAVGNLNDYVKFQMAQSIGKGDGGGGGLANSAAQLGAGLAMGQQLAAALNTGQSAPPVIAQPPGGGGGGIGGGGGGVQLMSPDEVAKTLGVSEADVLATLEKGELKGKKIGSVWRISKPALDDYLKELNPQSPLDAMSDVTAQKKFSCPSCGGEAQWNPAKKLIILPLLRHDFAGAGGIERGRAGSHRRT